MRPVCIHVFMYIMDIHTYARTDRQAHVHTHTRMHPCSSTLPPPTDSAAGVRWQVEEDGDDADGDADYDSDGTTEGDMPLDQTTQVSVTAAASLPNGQRARRSRPRSTVRARRSAPPPLCHLGGQRAFPAGRSVGPRLD